MSTVLPSLDPSDPPHLDPVRDQEWVAYELATGRELGRRPFTEQPPAQAGAALPVPDYLQGVYVDADDDGGSPALRLARAFLVFSGERTPEQVRGPGLEAAAASPDGRYLVALERDGGALLLCDLQDPVGDGAEGAAKGYLIAVDVVDAGVGERVLICDEGSSARQIFGIDTGPIRSVVVGIVDQIS